MKLIVDGRTAYAYTGGKPFEATLPCVVFVHGALNDHSVWTLLARWFAHHGHAVLAVDLPGHGRSEGPPAPDVRSAARWLLALLEAAGVGAAKLAGHSMGSLIALEAAAQAPERVSSLAMIGTAYPMKVSDALLGTAEHEPLAAIEMVTTFSLTGIASKPSFPGPGMWLHGGTRALMRRIQAQAQAEQGINLFLHDFRVCNAYAGGFEAAARVRCPVDFILGAFDQMTRPSAARELAAKLSARVHTVPSGHSMMAEAPDAVSNALQAAWIPAPSPAVAAGGPSR